MVYAQTRIRPRKWDASNSLGFSDKNQITQSYPEDLVLIKKKTTCHLADFDVSADHRQNERKWSDTNTSIYHRSEKAGEHESNSDTNGSWCIYNGLQ